MMSYSQVDVLSTLGSFEVMAKGWCACASDLEFTLGHVRMVIRLHVKGLSSSLLDVTGHDWFGLVFVSRRRPFSCGCLVHNKSNKNLFLPFWVHTHAHLPGCSCYLYQRARCLVLLILYVLPVRGGHRQERLTVRMLEVSMVKRLFDEKIGSLTLLQHTTWYCCTLVLLCLCLYCSEARARKTCWGILFK